MQALKARRDPRPEARMSTGGVPVLEPGRVDRDRGRHSPPVRLVSASRGACDGGSARDRTPESMAPKKIFMLEHGQSPGSVCAI